ncbi:hypothetical protein BUALT_Bualt14G0089900 [Buddleja alternifolia]|uniref:Dienelactone hydrolase domain-containing protein n=1 Tax=Buddleja alternifolia TaxID=168488 RepID=A0AAV6WMT2_9LAMI|nr:hypothetical protein BUALT_Bualt14G0089900 [Buddleja alternifolia]
MLGAQCTENPPTLSSTCGSGSVEEIRGLKTCATGNQHSKLAILMIADAFGYEAPKLRKLADKIAASGFLVVVPDFYYGDPYTPEQYEDKGCEDAKTVVAALKAKGVSKVGVAGMVGVRLAKFDCIDAAILLHPGPITVEEINEVKTPIAILGAQIDNHAPPELLKQLGDVLSAKAEVDSFVKIFPGVGHGWTTRYNDNDESAVKSAEESHLDMLNWFNKYIKIQKEEEMSGNQCCENPPTLSSSSGAGQVQQLGGLNCYVSGPADSKFAVVLISDVFGTL